VVRFDLIRQIAREALTFPAFTGKTDYCLCDRAERLVRNAERIYRLPELVRSDLEVDRYCLAVGTYFSDAGLAAQLRAKNTAAHLMFPYAGGKNLLEASADVVSKKLVGVMDQGRIAKIGRIITESGSHFTRVVEAMILSDSRNLDNMGAVGIFNEFRRHVAQGHGVSDALKMWQRKIDYQYWQARLSEGFRFKQVRKVAEQRLATARLFMEKLRIESQAGDVEGLSANSAPR